MEKQGGTLDWSREHNTDFKLDKTALLCISRKRVINPNRRNKTLLASCQSITICNYIIEPSRSHKFLGIIIDDELNFKEHATYALAKGTCYTMTCQRMTQAAKGVHSRLLKKLYEGVVIPKILYTADMERVQRMATTMITGGMRTTATDILDAHANILPFQWLLCKVCHRATLHMVTLDKTHPLHKGIHAAYNSCTRRNFKSFKRHLSLLHCLLNKFQINPHTIEAIDLTCHYPKWSPNVIMETAGDMTMAARQDAEADKDL
ncbi:hypothetical protein BDR04DRAFT_1130401 [Suillus decipiens]|nr:hypothetical protein BDR04DRAFT_1130401 [Suillus decipiens]